MSFKEAINYASKMDLSLLPYENEKGMEATREAILLKDCQSAGIIIGPEGGFEEAEVKLAKDHGIIPISLGRRILRTETAALQLYP